MVRTVGDLGALRTSAGDAARTGVCVPTSTVVCVAASLTHTPRVVACRFPITGDKLDTPDCNCDCD
jgi:hypothetical protein